MATGAYYPDFSYYQPPLGLSFTRGIACFRGFDGTWEDPQFRTNLRIAAALVKGNRVAAVVVYVVYRPGTTAQQAALFKAAVLATLGYIPSWLGSMIDMESWGGQIRGDQSLQANHLYALLCVALGNNPRGTLGYANRGDWGALWPNRPPQMRTVLAKYSTGAPSFPNLIAWQYTDGQWQIEGMPTSTPPLGVCDHNVALGLTPATFAAALGLLPGAVTDPLEDTIMALYGSKAEFEAALGRIVDEKLRYHGPRLLAALRTGQPNGALNGPASVIDGHGLDGALAIGATSPEELAVLQQIKAAIAGGFHIQINGETVQPAAPSTAG